MQAQNSKILWLVSITLPRAAAACGLPAREVGGGWLTGQLDALLATQGRPPLTICSVDVRVPQPLYAEDTDSSTAPALRFALLPQGSPAACKAVLEKESPTLVHIWGTEYAAATAMQAAAAALGIPVLIGIQGVMRDCAAHLCDDVPAAYLRSNVAQRCIDRVVPGALLDKLQQNFNTLAAAEKELLSKAGYVTGRTAFDKAATAALAPNATYYRCNETLRPAFYAPPYHAPRDFGSAPVLLLSQGNYPLKNLHTVLRALPAIAARYPQLVLKIAGWPPLNKGPLLQPVIDWMFPYQTYCKHLAKTLGVAPYIQYTGPLQAAAMRQAFLQSDVFLLPSYCENSPNSLGEAMLLGVPCVASNVGGIPDMLTTGVDGLLYGEAGDADALADAVCALLDSPAAAQQYAAHAQSHARRTHDAAANAAALLGIYRDISAREGTP